MNLQKEPVGEWTVANIIDNDREQWAKFHGFFLRRNELIEIHRMMEKKGKRRRSCWMLIGIIRLKEQFNQIELMKNHF